jgi:CHRD domain-containing protein
MGRRVASLDAGLARKIAASPRDWYVNLHTADFPAGAVRGQLHRARHLDLDLPQQLSARLSGANEVPPADPDGRGRALVETGRTRMCVAVAWTRIAPPIFAHIHAGPAGVNGPVVVLHDIRRHPRACYANVHNLQSVSGAIRGQLRRVA